MNVLSVTPEQALEAASAEMWGKFDVADRDCCRTAGWAFERLFGVNPVVDATYTSRLGALRYLRRYGGADQCHDTLARQAGLVACEAVPGVIGSVDVDARVNPLPWALGICIQNDEWAVMGAMGLNIIRSTARCWGRPEWG